MKKELYVKLHLSGMRGMLQLYYYGRTEEEVETD